MKDLQTKKAIVTGASQGLGLAMAEALCEEGVKGCIIDISKTLFDTVDAFKNKGYDVVGVQADLSNIEEIESVFKESLDLLGGEVDVLVNNAGIHKPLPAEELPIADFKKIFD